MNEPIEFNYSNAEDEKFVNLDIIRSKFFVNSLEEIDDFAELKIKFCVHFGISMVIPFNIGKYNVS